MNILQHYTFIFNAKPLTFNMYLYPNTYSTPYATSGMQGRANDLFVSSVESTPRNTPGDSNNISYIYTHNIHWKLRIERGFRAYAPRNTPGDSHNFTHRSYIHTHTYVCDIYIYIDTHTYVCDVYILTYVCDSYIYIDTHTYVCGIFIYIDTSM